MTSPLTDPLSVVTVQERVVTLAGWPTDTVAVDYHPDHGMTDTATATATATDTDGGHHQVIPIHTVLLFVPGNPGCIEWYTPNLKTWVAALGPGVAARGVSYAGHSPTSPSRTAVEAKLMHSSASTSTYSNSNSNSTSTKHLDISIPWTVDGQVDHKIAFCEHVLEEFEDQEHATAATSTATATATATATTTSAATTATSTRYRTTIQFLFVSHSIGAHMVERLCVLRPDLLRRTIGVVHLMPFTRMQALPKDQRPLDWAAGHPSTVIRIARTALQGVSHLPSSLQQWVMDVALLQSTMDDDHARAIAVQLLRQPTFARNFFELGTEEIRDVPCESFDTCAIRWISKQCPIHMLYAGNDQWAPAHHIPEWKAWQAKNHHHHQQQQQQQQQGTEPSRVEITYRPELKHDYVSHSGMVPTVEQWGLASMERILLLQQLQQLQQQQAQQSRRNHHELSDQRTKPLQRRQRTKPAQLRSKL